MAALKYVLNNRRTTYRLAVVVSKKISKSAVVRNKIRRRLYEAVRLHESDLVQPYDLVFTVFHEQLAQIPSDELRRLVRAQFRQAGILPSRPAKTPASRVKI